MKINYSYELFIGSSYCGPFGSSETFGVVEDGAELLHWKPEMAVQVFDPRTTKLFLRLMGL
jgi:hypothetical protein